MFEGVRASTFSSHHYPFVGRLFEPHRVKLMSAAKRRAVSLVRHSAVQNVVLTADSASFLRSRLKDEDVGEFDLSRHSRLCQLAFSPSDWPSVGRSFQQLKQSPNLRAVKH